jgi:hypothetical protein
MLPVVALEERPSFGAATEAQNHSLIISDFRASLSEREQSRNAAVPVDEQCERESSASSADENNLTGPTDPRPNDLGSKIQESDTPVEETSTLSERLAADDVVENESLRYADEWNFADDPPRDENPGADLEEQTCGEVVRRLGFEITDEQLFLNAGIIDDLFDFDPLARQKPWDDGERYEDGTRRAREKAATIAALVEITSRREQETILEWLTEFFLEFRHPATFRAIAGVADKNITPDLLRGVIALRRYWMECPEWWVSRSDLRREGYPLRKGSRGLGWALALRVCRYRSDCAPEDMIDEGWFDEWLALPPRSPGYFLFAAYVEAKVTNPDCELLHEGLVREQEYEGDAEMGDDRGWWRKLARYDESIRFGFSVLTPFRDVFGPPGYPETQNRLKRSVE